VGRKVHPIGFRLGIIRDWDARWFAPKNKYAEMLQQDFTIRRMVAREAPRSGIAKVDIDRFPSQLVVTIWTAKPGIVIGRKGAQVKVLRQKLEEMTGKRVKVEVEEITQPDLESQLVAENIADQIERRISHSRAMKRAIGQAMRQGAQGIKIAVAGRLGGSEMPRREWQPQGRVRLQPLGAERDLPKSEC